MRQPWGFRMTGRSIMASQLKIYYFVFCYKHVSFTCFSSCQWHHEEFSFMRQCLRTQTAHAEPACYKGKELKMPCWQRRKKSLWGVWWRAKISLFLRRKDQLWILPSKQTWLSSMLQDKTCYKSSLTGIRGEKIKQLDVNWTCFQVLCLDLTITFLKVPLDLETWFFPLYRSEPRQPSEQPLNMPTPYCLHRWYPGCGKEQTSDSVPSSQELFYMSGNHTPVKLAQALQLGGRNYK